VRTLRIALAMLVAVALLVAGAPSLPAQQQRAADGPVVTIAVFPLNGFMLGEDHRALGDAFRSMVISELSSRAQFRMLEREAIDSLLQAQAISASGMVSDEQAIRIGQLLGAQYAVAGGITTDPNDARLDLRLLDIETGEITHTFKDRVRRDRMLTVVDRVASEFAGRARVSERPVDLRIPVAASFAYSRGLDFEKRGRKQDAARMYRRALELFPQHPHAPTALRRVN
jgi:TolB-like protein